MSQQAATDLLLKCAQLYGDISQPLELLMLLIDFLGADVNAKDAGGNTVLHSLFTDPFGGTACEGQYTLCAHVMCVMWVSSTCTICRYAILSKYIIPWDMLSNYAFMWLL